MPPVVEVFFIVFTMMGAFFATFLLMYLLAIVLFPIEKGISDYVWKLQEPPPIKPAKTPSFKDFSKKYHN